jgi:hypothetical protein
MKSDTRYQVRLKHSIKYGRRAFWIVWDSKCNCPAGIYTSSNQYFFPKKLPATKTAIKLNRQAKTQARYSVREFGSKAGTRDWAIWDNENCCPVGVGHINTYLYTTQEGAQITAKRLNKGEIAPK